MDMDMAYDSDGFEQVPNDDDADLGGWVFLADQQQSPEIVPAAQSLQEKLKSRGSPDQLRHRGILRERKDNYFEGKCPGQAMSRLAGHMEAAVGAGDRNVKKWLETEVARMVEVVVDHTQKNATASTRATETLAAADRWSSGQNYHIGSGPGELCNKHTKQKRAPPKMQWFSKYAQIINTVPGNTVLNNEDTAELKDKRPVQVPLGRNYFTSTCPGVSLRNMPAGTTSRVPPPPRRRPPPPPASPPRPTCSKQAAPNNESERYRQAYDMFAPSTAKSLVALDRGLLKALLFHAVEAEISAMVDEDATAEPCQESGDGGAEALATVPPAGPHENIRAAAQRTLEQLRVAEARASLSALRGRANSPAGSYLGRRRLDALSKRLGANRGRVGRQLERARYARTRATARALFACGVGAAAGPDRRRDRDRELREAFGGGGGCYTRSRTPYARPRASATTKKKAKLTIAQKVAMAVDAEQLCAPSAESESERYRKAYNAFAYAPATSRLPMPGRAVPLIPPPPTDRIPPPPPKSEFPRIPLPPPPPPVYRVPTPAQRPAAAAPVRPVKGDGAIDDVDAWVRAGYGVGDGAHQLLARRAAMSSQV